MILLDGMMEEQEPKKESEKTKPNSFLHRVIKYFSDIEKVAAIFWLLLFFGYGFYKIICGVLG